MSEHEKGVRVGIAIGVVMAIIAIAISGCYHSESAPASIKKIAERDGYTVYRFWDGSDPYYFVTGDGHPRMIQKPGEKPQPEKTGQ
jgi:hypothetical protein